MTTCACDPTNCYAHIDLANARQALADYLATFERILRLHKPKHGRPATCTHCNRPWPCPTAKAALQPRQADP